MVQSGSPIAKNPVAPLAPSVYLSSVQQRQELVYYDRYERAQKKEGIYGEKPLRWAYETALGKIALEGVIKRPWFSALYGKWADCSCSRKEIESFVEQFELEPDEFEASLDSFSTFNEFFYRKLKPEARPLAPETDAVSFPADGRHLFVPNISEAGALWAKGQKLELAELLGDDQLASRYAKGAALISRLCPTDYHRFHFALAGVPGEPRLINGALYSVNPIALSRSLAYLWQNKRRVTVVRNSPVGDYLFLEIGATNVGSIVDTAGKGSPVERGDEKGYFRFGGSMVLLIFPESSIRPAEDLSDHSARGIELYAKVGDSAGTLCK